MHTSELLFLYSALQNKNLDLVSPLGLTTLNTQLVSWLELFRPLFKGEAIHGIHFTKERKGHGDI